MFSSKAGSNDEKRTVFLQQLSSNLGRLPIAVRRPSAAHLQILSVDDDDDVEAEARMELCKAIEIPPYAGRDLCGVERYPPDMNPFEMDFQNPCVSRYH